MDNYLIEVLDDTKQYLKFLKEIGCTGMGAGKRGLGLVEHWCADSLEGRSSASLMTRISGCRRCRLADERKSVVLGQGDTSADLMFIGPFPEAEDQDTGIPYSGKAGALLTRIIEAIGRSRDSVYISYAVKCRPASDRLPDKFEARACRAWLEEEIRAVCPQIICVLGGFAAQGLLKTDEPVSNLRGRFHKYEGSSVMPTHEPAYLLVNSSAKRAVWEDMKKVMSMLGA